MRRNRPLAIALGVVALVMAALIAIAVARRRVEGFDDMGPRSVPTVKPCEAYFTAERALCDAGAFETPRAVYEARAADLQERARQQPPSAADSAELSRLRAVLVAYDGLSGPACKVRFPDPWFRAVYDPDDTVYPSNAQPVECYVPPGTAVPPASGGVAKTPQTLPLGVTGAMKPYQRFEFANGGAKTFGGFYCGLPAVAAARAPDPRYDVGAGGAALLLTFAVARRGAAVVPVAVVGADGVRAALRARMRGFYDEQLVDDGAVTTLQWVPRLEASVEVLRLQRDACGVPYASAAFSDTCRVGAPVRLEAYRDKPRPAVAGTSADLTALQDQLRQKLDIVRGQRADAEALLRKQRQRYDTVLDVLLVMQSQYALQQSGRLRDMADEARQLETMPTSLGNLDGGAPPPAPPGAAPARAIAPITVPASLDLGDRPPLQRRVPILEKPTFVVQATPGTGRWAALDDATERYDTAPSLCPPGSFVTMVSLAADARGVHAVTSCRDPAGGYFTQSSAGGDLKKHPQYRPKLGVAWDRDFPNGRLFPSSDRFTANRSPFYAIYKADTKETCFNTCARDDKCAMTNYYGDVDGNNCHLYTSYGEPASIKTPTTYNWVKDASKLSDPAPATS